MKDLERMDRALLDLARDGHEPTDADRMRVRGGLASRLGVGAGLAVVTSTLASSSAAAGVTGAAAGLVGSTATAAGGLTMALATKVLVGLAIAAALGGGVVVYRSTDAARGVPVVGTVGATREATAPADTTVTRAPREPSPPQAHVVATVAPVDEKPSIAVEVLPASERPAPPAATAVVSGPTPHAVAVQGPIAEPSRQSWLDTPVSSSADPPAVSPRIEDGPPTAEVPATSRPATPAAPTTLEAETRLVRAGLAALHGGDAARALALFEEHARTFPNGVLADERDVERVEALCRLGRSDEVRAAAASFLRTRASSPLASRVRTACPAADTPR